MNERRGPRLSLFLTKPERETLERLAKKSGVPMYRYILDRLGIRPDGSLLDAQNAHETH